VLTIRRPARLSNGGAVPLLLLSQVLVNIGIGTFGVLYNLYLTTIGQSLAFIGTFNALSILALGASAIPIGAVTRTVGHRRTLGIGAVLLVVVQVVLATTSAPTPLLLAGVLWGVAQALSVVPVAPLISDSVPGTQRATAFGRLYAAWALATVVGSILGGILPNVLAAVFAVGPATGTAAYRGTLLLTTVITLLGWPLLLVPMAAQEKGTSQSPVDEPMGHGWALRSVRRTAGAVALTMALYSFACGLVAPFMNVYFAEHLHEPTALIGVLFAGASFLGVVGSLLGPRVSWRLGSIRAVAVMRLALVPCLFALTLGTLLPLLAMIGFVLRFALVFTAGALDAHFTLAAVPARRRPLLSGLRTGTYNLFFALGAWGAGHLIPQLGYSALFLWSAAFTTVGSVLFLGVFSLPRAAQ
jgi:predicted MFS family arabinose efflux permease